MSPLRALALAATAAALPIAALAAGNPSPPKPTETTRNCPEGTVWSDRHEGCLVIRDSRLTDNDRMEVARELAYHGRPADAAALLAGHSAPDDADVLTLRGFATRKAGDWNGGVALYRAALAREPDHWLARSYLGLGLYERGDRAAAAAQLAAIRASGGRGTWAERALDAALRDGVVSDY